MSSDSQRVLDSIRRLVQLLRLSDRAAERAVGLSGAQLFVLQELGRAPALSLNELAERTRTDQSSVSVVAARLVERRLVARERSLEDGRRVTISITPSGEELLREAPPVAQQKLLEALDSLSVLEQGRLSELFGRVVDAMGADGGAAPMFFEEESGSRPALVDSPRTRAGRGFRGERR